MTTVDSTSDARTVNNTLRHKYRVLSDQEKANMQAVKDKGQEFLDLIESIRSPFGDVGYVDGEGRQYKMNKQDRQLDIAAERIEEAVMWAVKHITA